MLSRLVSLQILPAGLIGTRFVKFLSFFTANEEILSVTKDNVEKARNRLINNLQGEETTITTKDKVKLNGDRKSVV